MRVRNTEMVAAANIRYWNCFSRSRSPTGWLDKLRASKGIAQEPDIPIDELVQKLQRRNSSGDSNKSAVTNPEEHCSGEPGECLKEAPASSSPGNSSGQSQVLSESGNADVGRAAGRKGYTFGLPADEFEKQQRILHGLLLNRRKRKQEKPSFCPRLTDSDSDPTLQQVQETNTQLQGSPESGKQMNSEVQDSPGSNNPNRVLQQEPIELQGSPESSNPSPVCRIQLETQLIPDYIDDCSGSLERACLEKMQAITLRSLSSNGVQDVEDDDCTSGSLSNSHRKTRANARTHICRKRRSPVDGERGTKRRRKLYARAPNIASTPHQVKQENIITPEEQLPESEKDNVEQMRTRRRSAHNSESIHVCKLPQTDDNFEVLRSPKTLPPDHPACQPKDTLMYSLYLVFAKAGKMGLSAREAVTKILDEDLPGLEESGVTARVEVRKIIQNSPYFMQLEETKYVLCSAMMNGAEDRRGVKKASVSNEYVDWSALAVRRARSGQTKRKKAARFIGKNPVSSIPSTPTKAANEEDGANRSNKHRLKDVEQDTTGLGNRCNRSDGKGWMCPLRARVGYLLCDHHLDRLRTKPDSRPRRPRKNREANAGNGNNGDGNGNGVRESSWGVRQSLSVARGTRGRKKAKVEEENEDQEEENDENEEDNDNEECEVVVTTSFRM